MKPAVNVEYIQMMPRHVLKASSDVPCSKAVSPRAGVSQISKPPTRILPLYKAKRPTMPTIPAKPIPTTAVGTAPALEVDAAPEEPELDAPAAAAAVEETAMLEPDMLEAMLDKLALDDMPVVVAPATPVLFIEFMPATPALAAVPPASMVLDMVALAAAVALPTAALREAPLVASGTR